MILLKKFTISENRGYDCIHATSSSTPLAFSILVLQARIKYRYLFILWGFFIPPIFNAHLLGTQKTSNYKNIFLPKEICVTFNNPSPYGLNIVFKRKWKIFFEKEVKHEYEFWPWISNIIAKSDCNHLIYFCSLFESFFCILPK